MTKTSNNKLKTEKEKDRTRQQLKFQRKKERKKEETHYFISKLNVILTSLPRVVSRVLSQNEMS
jgi:hypothetical protein